MSDLVEVAKKAMANVFVMYMKAHAAHWNYIGSDFPQYHKFFGKLYEELHGTVDDHAEQIRAMDSFAPGSLARIVELSSIEEDPQIPNPKKMVQNLFDANEKVIMSLMEANNLAEHEKQVGYVNFIQDRIQHHKKIRWMLKATLGKK